MICFKQKGVEMFCAVTVFLVQSQKKNIGRKVFMSFNPIFNGHL